MRKVNATVAIALFALGGLGAAALTANDAHAQERWTCIRWFDTERDVWTMFCYPAFEPGPVFTVGEEEVPEGAEIEIVDEPQG